MYASYVRLKSAIQTKKREKIASVRFYVSNTCACHTHRRQYEVIVSLIHAFGEPQKSKRDRRNQNQYRLYRFQAECPFICALVLFWLLSFVYVRLSLLLSCSSQNVQTNRIILAMSSVSVTRTSIGRQIEHLQNIFSLLYVCIPKRTHKHIANIHTIQNDIVVDTTSAFIQTVRHFFLSHNIW